MLQEVELVRIGGSVSREDCGETLEVRPSKERRVMSEAVCADFS